MKKTRTTRLWGAAFSQEPAEAVIAFTAGRDVASVPMADVALISYDLWVNKAHCVMLAKTGSIAVSDAAQILDELETVNHLVQSGTFILDPSKEDVHTNIESWLTAKLGRDVAGKLHTARSRNDQVVTDMKLFMRDQVLLYISNCIVLVHTLLTLAAKYKSAPIPGFTHHQLAMVTTFGHILAGFANMVIRDIERFRGWYVLHNTNPLGNAASYGTTFPVDRKMTAMYLGFDGPDHNALDAISNRWEPEADLSFAIVTLMNHLSSIAQTLMLLSTSGFGMVTLADQFCTGSSIMPQKKNPDPLEVLKGKTGYALGQHTSLLSMGKGNFIGYNRDSQWTKYIIMDLVAECLHAPVVLSGVLETMSVDTDAMKAWCHKGQTSSTTVMEHMVQTNMLSMREAKIRVERLVKAGSPDIDMDPEEVISRTKSYGGPGKNSMKTSLKKLNRQVAVHAQWLAKKTKEKRAAQKLLAGMIDTVISEGTKIGGDTT